MIIVFSVTIVWRATWQVLPELSLGQDCTLGKFYLWPFMFWLHWTLGAIAAKCCFGNLRVPKLVTSRSLMVLLFGGGLLLNRKTLELIASTGPGRSFAEHLGAPYTQILSSLGEIGIAVALFMLLYQAVRSDVAQPFEGLVSQSLAKLGRVSYSLYLTHVPILFVLEQHLPIAETRFQWPVRLVLYLSICIVAGGAYFHAVERWFLSGKCPIRFRRSRLEANGVAIP